MEKTLESPLDCKEIQPGHPKGNQPWISIGRTDAEAEVLILWPPDAKSWLIGKDPDAVKDWGEEEKQAMEDEMVGWHHRFNEHEFEQTLRDSKGQGSLVCCSPWGDKESDTAEWPNNNTPDVCTLVYSLQCSRAHMHRLWSQIPGSQSPLYKLWPKQTTLFPVISGTSSVTWGNIKSFSIFL